MPRRVVGPCLRIRRLGVRISSGALTTSNNAFPCYQAPGKLSRIVTTRAKLCAACADPERLRGGVGAGTAGGRHRRQRHILEAAQRRDVGIPGPAAVRVGADDTDAQRTCHAMPSPRWWVGHVTLRRAAICLAAIIIRLSVVLRASELTAGLDGQPSLLVRIGGYRRRACNTRVKT
jgi:hypothetical protein